MFVGVPEANSVGLRRPRVLPARPGQAAMIIAAFTGVLYLTEAVDTLLNGALDQDGVRPRQLNGLEGILWAPVLHASWQHLAANTVAVLVFGFFALAGGAWQDHLFGAVSGLIAAYLVAHAGRVYGDRRSQLRLTRS
jgi:membrane associated rhomboid family serine protease